MSQTKEIKAVFSHYEERRSLLEAFRPVYLVKIEGSVLPVHQEILAFMRMDIPPTPTREEWLGQLFEGRKPVGTLFEDRKGPEWQGGL